MQQLLAAMPDRNSTHPAPPRFSVCIPAYNDCAAVARAVASVLGQRVDDLECIVCDDSDHEAIAEHVRGLGDTRLRYYRNRPALGAPRNWNAALAKARGAIVTLLHQDDWYRSPQVLSEVERRMSATGAEVLCCGRALYRGGLCLGEYTALAGQVRGLRADFPGQSLVVNRLGHPSVFFFRNAARQVRYNEELRYFVDTEYYRRLLSAASRSAALEQALVAVSAEGALSAACLAEPERLSCELRAVLRAYGAGNWTQGLALGRLLASHARHWVRQGPAAWRGLLRPFARQARLAAGLSLPLFAAHMLYRLAYRRFRRKPWG